MQKHILLCTNEYAPDHGGVARYLSGMVAHSAQPVVVERVARSARWFSVFRTLWRATARSARIGTVWCSHLFPIGTACYLLSYVRRIPYVMFFHGMDIALVEHASGWRRWLAGRIVARAAAVYANSQYTATLVQRVTGREDIQIQYPRIEPLPTGADRSVRATLGISPTDNVVLSVARLVHRKGIDRVLRAAAALAPSVSVVVIGDGPERETLLQLAATLGIADRVHVLGAVDDATTYAWYQAADLFVLPPRALATDVEGFGMVYLEAGWYGLPVIATRTGGISDAVADMETGYLITDSDDPEPLIRSIDQLLQDAPLRARMGARAQTRIRQQFVWNEPNNHS